jgi:acetyltransferase-like isoleucine patch superfamily enzyme
MLKSFCRTTMRYVVRFFPGSPFRGLRATLWNSVGFDVHASANLSPTSVLICESIRIGAETFVGEEVMITGGDITIGARCDLAPRVLIHAGSHELGEHTRRAGRTFAGAIRIGDGSWLGAGSIVLAGVNIGPGTVVAAGSVVKAGEYPANVLLAGTPAVVKKHFN